MRLVIEKAAARRLLEMPPAQARALRAKLEAIAADPFGPHPHVTALQGEKDTFRVRQGDWRAVYVVERAADTVRVRIIDVRGQVYR
ncbi:type II toxin-antitoxin system RelE/ParE family toxin [Aerophototrophica crusticola]|uniref:Type II toxin-antitoxin system RelE/ParE family toxin n=1 Tax=Aerophototrophica crusticola TaxID=1709002 RepID=A0A858R9E0_9PROT|nr:type II toxin-antitoxin system RelE/ParE family toxin [Rhodospirillaceae bacterium B3]